MKIGFYLDVLRFQKEKFSFTKLIDFLLYLKEKYFPYKDIEEIYSEIWDNRKEELSNELKLFLALDLEILYKLREEYVLLGNWDRVNVIDEAIKRKTLPDLKNLERNYFYAYTYLSRVSNITYNEFLELDYETLELLLKDKNIEELSKKIL